jgi:purine-binding chemotaxis protein CheW
MSTKQFATFRLGDHFLGLEVQRVQEVLRHQLITPVPLADSAVAGLINLRGQVVTAIDLRRRMQLPPRPEGTEPMNVVVRVEEEVLSLLVDGIGDVIDVDQDDFEAPPETLSGPSRELIRGAYKLDGALLLSLDVDRAVDLQPLPG